MTSARDVLAIPAVRHYLVSTASAAIGLNIIVTVVFKQAFDTTGNALDIGWLGLAQFVPAVLLVLVSGWVADRFDRRRVTSLFLLVRTLCTVALVVYSIQAPGTVWQLFVVAFLFGASDAMMVPSRRSMAPLLAPVALFPRVVGLWTATLTGATIAGPVLGGFLYSVGPAQAYLVAAALQLLAIVPLIGLVYARTPERITDRPTWSAAVEGLRFVRRTPVVLGVISLDLFAVLFGGAVALIPVVASDRLGVGDIAYGWLRAAPGIGAAAMAIVLAVRPVRRRVGPRLLWAVGVFGFATVVFGLTRNYVVAFAALVVAAAADMVSVFIRSSIIPLVTPEDQLGRVTAVEGVFIGASNELGAFESGVAARAVGVPLAIAGGGVITMLIAGGFAWAFPAIRRIDTFDELSPETERAPAGSDAYRRTDGAPVAD